MPEPPVTDAPREPLLFAHVRMAAALSEAEKILVAHFVRCPLDAIAFDALWRVIRQGLKEEER